MKNQNKFIIMIFLLTFSFFCNLVAGSNDAEKKKKDMIRDNLLYNSAQGREFWLAIPPNEKAGYSAHALEMYITSSKNTSVTMELPNLGVMVSKDVKAMEITTYSSLSGDMNWDWEVRESEEVSNKGIHLTADQPISVYVLNAKQFTSDGYLGLPTSAIGTEYIHCAYYDFAEIGAWVGGFIIVSGADNTRCNITLRGKSLGNTTAKGAKIGSNIMVPVMGPGQTYMVAGDGLSRGTFDLTGSRVISNKPIGFISYHERCIIPSWDIWNGRDALNEMMTPVHAWGKKYCTVELKRDSQQGDFFRVVGSQDATNFKCMWFDLMTKEKIAEWPGYLKKAGDFSEWLETVIASGNKLQSVRGLSIFEADKPIMVMQYSYSADWDGNAIFDPLMFLVTPVEQYIPGTVFQTPSSVDFIDNYFNIVAIGDTTDYKHDDLKSIKLDDKFVFNMNPVFLSTQIPGTNLFCAKLVVKPGAHKISGNTKFGGYIYGFSNYDSYGWPAAMALNKLDELDTLPPVLTIEGECGVYKVKATEKRNGKANDNPLQVDQGVNTTELVDGSYNCHLEPKNVPNPYPPVYEYNFKVIFDDLYQRGKAIFAVTDRAGNSVIDSITWVPDSVRVNPNPIVYGNVRLRTSKSINVEILNVSDSTVFVEDLKLLKGQYFSIDSGMIPPIIKLIPKQKHIIKLTYSPLVEGLTDKDVDEDSLIVTTHCLQFPIYVKGRGVIPRIWVEDWDAKNVPVNQKVCKSQQTGTGLHVRNDGTDTLIITGLKNVAAPFTVTNLTPALPIKVEPGANKDIYLNNICAQPLATLQYSIDVTLENNGDGPDSISNWKVKGEQPGPYITSKNWLERRVKTINDSVLVLKNAGTTSVLVTDLNLSAATNNFILDKSKFSPTTLEPQTAPSGVTEIIIPVTFNPQAEGPWTANVIPSFDPAANIPVGSVVGVLEGVGILPKIQVTGDEFLPAILVNTIHPKTGYLTIKNPSTSADLHVKSIKWSPSSVNPTEFSWVGTPPVQDTMIKRGESFKIPVSFSAKGTNLRIATIDVQSDASEGPKTDPTVTTSADIKGYGIDQGIRVTDIDFGSILMCDAPVKTFQVTNISTTDTVILSKIDLISIAKDFTLLNPPINVVIPPNSGATLGKNFVTFSVKFTPSNVGNFSVKATVYTTDGQSKVSTITGTAYRVNVDFKLPSLDYATHKLAPGMMTDNGSNKFVVLASSKNWDDAKITSFKIEIKYSYKYLVYQTDRIYKGSILPGSWSINAVETNALELGEKIRVLTISGSTTNVNDYIKSDGELAIPVFQLMLDSALIKPKYGNISFLDRDLCVTSTNSPGLIEYNLCARDLRSVIIIPTTYELVEIQPNPVSGGTIPVKYGVGLEDVQTSIKIFNASSEMVKEVYNGISKSGKFEKEVNVSDLSSGVYFIVMESGPFKDMKRIVIRK
ncbi:MAG: choice-of-anchor D domain-containing protein [Candidatus Kapabacteria bacterium]|nr:choice-of-anchor D domain-containing protein [Candidatus Kapabacteria bacterium]